MDIRYNPFSLSGKTILITGASSGIGKAAAIECAKSGAMTILIGRNKEKLDDTDKTIKELVLLLHCFFMVILVTRIL